MRTNLRFSVCWSNDLTLSYLQTHWAVVFLDPISCSVDMMQHTRYVYESTIIVTSSLTFDAIWSSDVKNSLCHGQKVMTGE